MIGTILWDWNGTLVDDIRLTVDVLRDVFARHGGCRPVTLESYRREFCFPAIDFYERMGVSREDFPEVGSRWNDGFIAGFHDIPLQPGAVETLRRFRAAGRRQIILSAAEQSQLEMQMSRYPELTGLFDDAVGRSDVLGGSKVETAVRYIREHGIRPEEAVFVGDTLHDAETAAAIGCRCLLVSGGHQDDTVLARAGVPVAASLADAADRIFSEDE